MQLSPSTRAAQKTAQLARLAAKGKPGYAALYASQPEEVRIAAEQGKARKVVRDAKEALNLAALKAAGESADVFSAAKVSSKARSNINVEKN